MSSHIAPNHSIISASSLHSFKSNGSVEKEIDRLELTPGSLVYLPEDQHGKLNVLRITGLSPRERDENGNLKISVTRKEEVWLIALENVEMLKIWMAEIKGVVHELGGVNTATPVPSSVARSGSFSSNMSGGGARRESEVHDNSEVRSSTSMSMSSLSRYPGANSPIGYSDSSTNAYYRPNTVTSTPISLPLPLPPRISTSPINLPARPPRPPRSPRSPSNNNLFQTSTTSKSSGQIVDEDDSEFDESTIHPYSSRPSIARTNNITSKGLVIPVSGPNFARRGSADSGLQSPASNHSGKSNASSISTSSLLYTRSPAPMGPLPDTPPPSEFSRNASINTIETKGTSRTSFISTSSNGSSKSRTSKAPPPPMPAPTGSLPLPPTANGVPLLPLVLPRLVKQASPNASSKFVVPPRREFSTAPLPPPTGVLPLPPTPQSLTSKSFPISAPSALPPPPPPTNIYSTTSSLPPPTSALPPIPTSPPAPEFPRPPPRSLERRPTTRVANNSSTTP